MWRVIPSFPRYEISSMGEVRIRKTRFVMRQAMCKGYPSICLCSPDITKNRKMQSVHRLVWQAHRGPIPSGLQINHIDGVKTNNNVENLELVTHQQNTQHAKKMGLMLSGDAHPQRMRPDRVARGERQGLAKLTEADVIAIRAAFPILRMGRAKLARQYGVNWCTIDAIISRKTWKHVP